MVAHTEGILFRKKQCFVIRLIEEIRGHNALALQPTGPFESHIEE